MQNLKDLSCDELKELIEELGEKSFRAAQVWQWLYEKRCLSIDEMTNLSKTFREKLAQEYCADGLETSARQKSGDGTVKYLFKLVDGLTIETVFIPDKKRGTVCLSTQVGCKFSCAFCATGRQGFTRDLTQGEILNQLIEAKRDSGTGEVTNVVFMGMGEPLDNLDRVVGAIEIINSDKGFNIGARRITVSTVGIAPAIERLGELDLNVNLALSLHSADNSVRTRLMPVNKKYPIAKLMQVLKNYPLKAQRRITMEAILFDGVNDSAQDAQKMVKALHGIKAKVNLISFNSVEAGNLKPSPKGKVKEFQQRLIKGGIAASIRQSKGSDIEAACGQLKSTLSK